MAKCCLHWRIGNLEIIHHIQDEYMTDEEHTTAPTKSPIQLLKTQSTSIEEDKLLCIHHMLCNLILLSYSLHANEETPLQTLKKLKNFQLRFLTTVCEIPSLTSTLTLGR